MKRISSKTKYIISGIILVVLTLGIAIAVNESYKVTNGYVTLWQPADALDFYGSYLAFLGTVVLGAVAVHQSKKAHSLNEQLQKLQQAQYVSMISAKKVMLGTRSHSTPTYLNAQMPKINFIDLIADGFTSKKCYHIDVEFKNESEYPIVEMQVHPGPRTNDNCHLFGMKHIIDQAVYIAKGESVCFRYIVPCERFEEKNQYGLQLIFVFINVFDYKTPAALHIPDLQDKSLESEYQYRLSKFIDVKPSNH